MNRPAPHPFFSFVLRLAAFAVTGAVVLFLLTRAAIPEGRLVTRTDFSGPAPFLSEPMPSARLSADPVIAADGTISRALVNSPLYLDVRPPAAFDTVAVELAYEAHGRAAVEIGALASSLDGKFDMRPAEHGGIDLLAWPRVASGDYTLLQREPRYASLDGFYAAPPPVARIATYHADADLPYRIDGYAPSGVVRTMAVSLRGSHRFLAYAKDEPLSFSFALQDMNRGVGADPAVITVTRLGGNGTVLARADLDDDGEQSDNQKSVGLRTLAVSLADPEEGVYQVTVTASSDVFIREISTRQSKLVIQGNAYLGDFVGYSDRMTPITLWSDARRLVLRTAHVEGLQTATVGGQEIPVEEIHARYLARLPGRTLTEVRSPRRDLLLESDGLFALSPGDWFDPLPFMISYDTTPEDLDALGIDYVLMRYETPTLEGGTRHATAVFETASMDKYADGDYRLAISAPGSEDGMSQVRLVSATVTMRRRPIGWVEGIMRLFGRGGAVQESDETMIFAGGEAFGETLP